VGWSKGYGYPTVKLTKEEGEELERLMEEYRGQLEEYKGG